LGRKTAWTNRRKSPIPANMIRTASRRPIEQPDVWTFGSGVVRYPSCPS
jgi:hypothetical protein